MKTLEQAKQVGEELGFPLVIRPSFTMGGVGGGIAYNLEEFKEIAGRGLILSPVHEILVEESVIGWKEFELEVMRDVADNFVVICSIENIDAMGVHTGDSVTVAPALTLTDKEYQRMRDMGRRIIRRVIRRSVHHIVQLPQRPEEPREIHLGLGQQRKHAQLLARHQIFGYRPHHLFHQRQRRKPQETSVFRSEKSKQRPSRVQSTVCFCRS